LGDEYSVNWMEDSDASVGLKKTLKEQLATVTGLTKGSKVHQYGDKKFEHKTIGHYQGVHHDMELKGKTGLFKKVIKYIKNLFSKKPKRDVEYEEYIKKAKESIVDSRKVKLAYLIDRASVTNDSNDIALVEEEKASIARAETVFQQFNEIHSFDNGFTVENIDFVCLRSNVKAYEKFCTKFTDYSLQFVKNIAYACEKKTSSEVYDSIKTICEN